MGAIGKSGLDHRHEPTVRAACWRTIVPGDDVQDDCVVGRIAMVAMRVPVTGFHVDFHGAATKFPLAKEEDGVCEIRAESMRPGAAVNNTHRSSVGSFQEFRELPAVPGGTESDFRNPPSRLHQRLDLEGSAFDGWKSRLAAFAVPAELINRCLQRTEGERRTAHAAANDLFSHFIGDF